MVIVIHGQCVFPDIKSIQCHSLLLYPRTEPKPWHWNCWRATTTRKKLKFSRYSLFAENFRHIVCLFATTSQQFLSLLACKQKPRAVLRPGATHNSCTNRIVSRAKIFVSHTAMQIVSCCLPVTNSGHYNSKQHHISHILTFIRVINLIFIHLNHAKLNHIKFGT